MNTNKISAEMITAMMRVPGNVITAERTVTESYKKGWRSRRVTREVRLCIAGAGTPDFIDTTRGRVAIKTLTVLGIESRQTLARKAAWKKRKANQAARQFFAQTAQAISTISIRPLALPLYSTANTTSPLAVLAAFVEQWKLNGRNAVHSPPADVMAAKAVTGMSWCQIVRL